MSLSEIIINMVIVSIPEEMCMTFIALFIMKRYDFFDMYTIKTNLRNVLFLVVIPTVLLFTFTLYGTNLNIYTRLSVNLLGFSTLLFLLTREKQILKIFGAVLITYILVIFLETLTFTISIYIFNFDFSTVNINPYRNFIITSPFRLAQVSILYICYRNKNAIYGLKIFDIWYNNRPIRKIVYMYLIFNLLMLMYAYNVFIVKSALINMEVNLKLGVVSVALLFFIGELIFPWVAMYTIYPSEKLRVKYGGGKCGNNN